MHRESQSLCARLSLASSSVEILIKANLLYFPTLPYLLSPFPDLADSGGAVEIPRSVPFGIRDQELPALPLTRCKHPDPLCLPGVPGGCRCSFFLANLSQPLVPLLAMLLTRKTSALGVLPSEQTAG